MPVSGRRAVRPDGGLYRQRRRKKVSKVAIIDIFRTNPTGNSGGRRRFSIWRIAALVWLIAMIVVIYLIWRYNR